MRLSPVQAVVPALALAALLAPGCQSRPELSPEQTSALAPLLAGKPKTTPDALPAASPRGEPGTQDTVKVRPENEASPGNPSIQQTSASEALESPRGAAAAEVENLATSPTPVSAAGPLGLPEVIETGLARNPDLVTLRQSEGVGRAVLGVAQTYPFNPTVQIRVLPYNSAPSGAPTNLSTYNYVLLWQQFELAHQRRFRAENAAAALDGTRWNIHQAELQNVALTTQLYFAALYQRGLLELAEMTAAVNEKLLAVAEKRVQAGQASAADAAQARFDTRTIRQQTQLANIAFQNALLALRRQLNLPADAPLALQGELTEFTWSPVSGPELCKLLGDTSVFTPTTAPETLASELAARRPDVLAARANVHASQANIRLAKASRLPNLWFGPFYQRDQFALMSMGLQGQWDIPVVNTGQPLVRQRQAELRQQLTNLEQLEAKARVEARTALERYERARLLHEQTRADANQQVPLELQKLEAEFNKGEVDIVRITQMRNSLIQFRRTHLDTLNELGLATAALIGASGLPPAALVSRPCVNAVPLRTAEAAPAPDVLPETILSPGELPSATISIRVE